MSNEIKIASPQTALTVYALIINSNGYFWNGSSFEIYTSGNYANYPISLTEQGSSGNYFGTFPTSIITSGNYQIIGYSQQGVSPAEGDPIAGSASLVWNGSTLTVVAASATLSSLVAEGLALAGDANPSSALTTRAQGNWVEQIKNDIWRKCKNLKSLQTTGTVIINQGQSIYNMPTDYAGAGEISMRFLDGTKTGSAQAATSNTITLASSESADLGYMMGKQIAITAGTAAGQISQIISYNSTTKIATVYPTWGTTPAVSDTYLIVERYISLEQGPAWDFDLFNYPNVQRQPCSFYPIGNESYGQFLLDTIPNKTYVSLIRYYVNIMTIDTSGTLMDTLYQKYRNVWIQGVFAMRLKDLDDNRAPGEFQLYYNLLSEMIGHEKYGEELHQLQIKVSN